MYLDIEERYRFWGINNELTTNNLCFSHRNLNISRSRFVIDMILPGISAQINQTSVTQTYQYKENYFIKFVKIIEKADNDDLEKYIRNKLYNKLYNLLNQWI